MMKPPFSLVWWVFLDEALVLSLESNCTPVVLHGCKLFPLRCSFFSIILFSTSEVGRGKHGLLGSCTVFFFSATFFLMEHWGPKSCKSQNVSSFLNADSWFIWQHSSLTESRLLMYLLPTSSMCQ